MEEKSISRWEKAAYWKSKSWKKLGQVLPKDAPFLPLPMGLYVNQ